MRFEPFFIIFSHFFDAPSALLAIFRCSKWRTELAKVPSSYRPLTSVQSRGQRVTMGTYLLSRIRDAMNMDMPLGGALLKSFKIIKKGPFGAF